MMRSESYSEKDIGNLTSESRGSGRPLKKMKKSWKYQIETRTESSNQHLVKRIEGENWKVESYWRPVEEKTMKRWMKIINSQKLLKELTIKSCPVIFKGDAEIHFLGEMIKQFGSLEKIEFDFPTDSKMTNDGVYSLCRGLKKCSSLKIFHLHFPSCPSLQFSENTLCYLENCLKRMVSLRDVSLVFPSDMKEVKNDLKRLVEGMSRLKFLQKLSLGFRRCGRINEKNLEDLSEILKKFVKLETISLDFYQCNGVNDVSLHHLGQSFKMLSSLHVISLDFSKCMRVTSLGIQNLFEGLKTMILLKKLNLDLSKCRGMNDVILPEIFHCLENMEFLERLELSFEGCVEITGAGLIESAKSLKNLKSLRWIWIDVSECPKVSERGTKAIKESLEELPFLEAKYVIYTEWWDF